MLVNSITMGIAIEDIRRRRLCIHILERTMTRFMPS